VNWRYRTILFEYQKDGLLGDRYIDDEEVETTLNEQGLEGWELVSVTQIKDGLLAFCKRPEGQLIKAQGDEREVVEGRVSAPLEERSPVTAEELQKNEIAHIRRLEEERQETMKRQEQDILGEIKIR